MASGDSFRSMDAYGESLPSFNIKGKERVNTIVGGFLSIILYMIVFMYGVLKFTHMVAYENPNITGYDIEDGGYSSRKWDNLYKHGSPSKKIGGLKPFIEATHISLSNFRGSKLFEESMAIIRQL